MNAESEALEELQNDLFNYIIQKAAINKKDNSTETLVSIQEYLNFVRATHTETSHVAYMEVLDAVSDSKDTMLALLHDLYAKFISNQNREYLVLEADQKLYEILQSLKFEYGKELNWLIVMPGDWHILMNYQSAIMKPYFDAGLKDLANAASYPVASIQTCGQFKRTHHFLIEAWEALYRAMITAFLSHQTQLDSLEDPLKQIEDPLELIYTKVLSKASELNDATFCQAIASIETEIIATFESFTTFVQNLAKTDDTWRFWIQFVFQDFMAYISLFLAIRSGDWPLRIASIKQMAAIYTAFDHMNYCKLIGRHLSDLLSMPLSILTMFQQGAFVVSIKGRAWHSVAIDEGHEMLINKACKTAVVRPSPDYVNRIARYLPFRSKALENLFTQLFPEENKAQTDIKSPISKNADDLKREHNIIAQIEVINKSKLLHKTTVNRGLINPFTKKVATSQQTVDLLNFRDIGQKEFLHHVSSRILKQPSTSAPTRKKRLQTFSSKKVTKQRLTQLEKDRNLILACMRKKIKWSRQTGKPIKTAREQLIALPLAITDHDGNPKKGQKSLMTKALVKRYATPPIIQTDHPQGWQLQCCLMEGMFLINTAPLGIHSTYGDYATFLMQRHITSYFNRGCCEVHLLFDNPEQLKNTPKYFEQNRRDQSARVSTGHTCSEINETDPLPKKWRENVINCRRCKRSLVCFIAQFILKHVYSYLSPEQKFFVAGAFTGDLVNTTWFTDGNGVPQPDPRYSCNAAETDTRLWLHAKQTTFNNILVLSPDTDVYIIGLTLQCSQEKDIIVQISAMNSREQKLIRLKNLFRALSDDPDLAGIAPSTLPNILQTLFVVSGCDYTSFFHGMGKATFLRCFCQHALFITGETSFTSGSLSDTTLDNDVIKRGFLSFIRLIGTMYFKKYGTAFDLLTPEAHYKKFVTSSTSEAHYHNWLEDIRQTIWDRTIFEEEMIPSTEALWRHWMRSCWVIDMWKQASSNCMQVADINSYGWKTVNDVLTINWDSDSNLTAVQERVALLTKGCQCKTGCSTTRCSCKKKGNNCSEGCSCLHCANLPNFDCNSPASRCGDENELYVDLESDEDSESEENEDDFQSFVDSIIEDDIDTESYTNSDSV